MIEFRLDSRSGVPTYLQLVHQVRQALRLGILQPGDQLPTVKEVVARLAINPNTVLKAYRELDRDGLVDARRGQGTFLSKNLAPTASSDHAALQETLLEWVAQARRAGFDEEGITALMAAAIRAAFVEMLKLGRKLNPSWDDGLAHARLDRLGLSLRQRVGKLSGGQQAQLALTLALAKRPELLLLDEPVASLDPLARREFLQSLMEAVADGGLTVVLSSHILADLERVCDHLVILSRSTVQLAGPIDEIVAAHRVLTGVRS